MINYRIYKKEDSIRVFGHEQTFTNEELKDLWEKHKILYLEGGIMALWVEEREEDNPLVHLMGEDDGLLFWDKENDRCFDSYWIDNYVNTFKKLKKILPM